MPHTFRLVLLSLIVIILSSVFFSHLTSPISPGSTVKIGFVIKPGQDLDQITKLLKRQKIIRSATLAKFLILQKGLSKKIQAGYFYLSPSQNLQEIIVELTKAASKQVWVTIPEGLRRQETARIINKAFVDSGGNQNFDPYDFIALTASDEGRLFPETYAFNPDSSTEQVISKLINQFNRVVKKLGIPSQDVNKTLIIASLLERESRNTAEMEEIAGILKKRVAANWPLQIDATVQFALANQRCQDIDCDYWPADITKQNLKIPSPYNTYNHAGLPAGPISNPGEAALKAAFLADTSDYWFYLHDLNGDVHFSKTVEDHNQNICAYLKKSC